MTGRIAVTDVLQVDNVVFGSVCKLGDTVEVRPTSRVFALQRERPDFDGSEEKQAEAFMEEKTPIPTAEPDVRVNVRIRNEHPFIVVERIRVISASTAGVVHLGNCRTVEAESRVKHIRQFLTPPE